LNAAKVSDLAGELDFEQPTERAALVRRGLLLNWVTLAYNSVEGIVALAAGFVAGSVVLVGFGADSLIEVIASGAAQWRLRTDLDHVKRERVERVTLLIIGWSFLALAVYISVDSAKSLWLRERPERSIPGLVILSLSVVIMPLLARAKRRVARAMASRALESEAFQTTLCAYLSGIALLGVVLNAFLGWWWADPVAAIAMVPIIAKEGVDGVRGQELCDDCAPPAS
jgi:divalent metal cation (Fe/Co/Zn/Cd) transporter